MCWYNRYSEISYPCITELWCILDRDSSHQLNVSPNGKYMSGGGSTSIYNFISSDFGSTFVSSVSTSDKITSSVDDDGYIYYADESGTISSIESVFDSTPVIGTYDTTSFPGSISVSPDGIRVVHVGPQGVASGKFGYPISNYTSRTDFCK
jgi:hypothetical protein